MFTWGSMFEVDNDIFGKCDTESKSMRVVFAWPAVTHKDEDFGSKLWISGLICIRNSCRKEKLMRQRRINMNASKPMYVSYNESCVFRSMEKLPPAFCHLLEARWMRCYVNALLQ